MSFLSSRYIISYIVHLWKHILKIDITIKSKLHVVSIINILELLSLLHYVIRVCIKSCRIFLNTFAIGQESMMMLLLCRELFHKFLCSLCKFTTNNTEIKTNTK